jgi:Ca2+-binding RTX toxin-like protein
MLPPPIDYKCDRNTIEISSLIGIGVLGFTLVSVAASFSISTSDSNIWAITRGTMYDDLLISDMINDSNQTDQMSIAEATGMQGSQNARSDFIYGDYGNDEIQGYNRSDHLSGGPGNDVIYGNDGGDFIQGGPGIDSLYGEAGDDVLSGGEGADYFDCGPGRDSIDDFDPSEGDYALNNCEVIENEERPSR